MTILVDQISIESPTLTFHVAHSRSQFSKVRRSNCSHFQGLVHSPVFSGTEIRITFAFGPCGAAFAYGEVQRNVHCIERFRARETTQWDREHRLDNFAWALLKVHEMLLLNVKSVFLGYLSASRTDPAGFNLQGLVFRLARYPGNGNKRIPCRGDEPIKL